MNQALLSVYLVPGVLTRTSRAQLPAKQRSLDTQQVLRDDWPVLDDGTRNIHGHCGRDYRDQVLCGVTLSKP